MRILTTGLTINAAFLQEIKEDSQELRLLFRQVSGHLCKISERLLYRRELFELVVRLRDQLAMHFALEEAFGYFNDAIDTAPHLSEKAEDLKADHGRLFVEICRICDEAEAVLHAAGSMREIAAVADLFDAFASRFHDHEARENQLILEAFDDDIGCGD